MSDDEWTEQDVRDWLGAGFTWLKGQWEEDPDKSWDDLSSGLLGQLQATEENAVVAALLEKVGEKDDDDAIYAMFTNEEEEKTLLDELVAVWQEDQASTEEAGEAAADADQVDTSQPYWDGEQWLKYDEASGEWLPTEDAGAASEATAAPEQVSADVAEKIAAPALAEAMANSEALRGLSADERNALLGEVIAARMSTA